MGKNILKEIPKYMLLIAVVAACVVFGIIQPRFFAVNNLMDILRTSSIIGLLAVSGVIIWSTGETNFAIGSQLTMGSAILGWMMIRLDPKFYIVGVLVTLLILTLSGILVCIIVVELGVPSFIATLAMSTAIDGIDIILTGNTTLFSSNWGKVYTVLGQSYLFKVIPTPVVIFAVVAVIINVFMNRTKTGNAITAIGANITASRQVGVNVNRTKYISFALGSFVIGIAGVLETSINNNVVMTSGADLLMPAICATVLSATFLTIGKYNVPGAVVASLLIILLQNGVISVGGTFYDKYIVQGIVLLIAVGVIALVRKGGLPSVKFEN